MTCFRTLRLFTLAMLALVASSCATPAVSSAQRPAAWAKPLAAPGLPNLQQVTPQLYRAAQPQPQGYASLQAMGIRSIVNFRTSDTDTAAWTHTPNAYCHIPWKATSPRDAHVVRFLQFAADPAHQPLLVHCRRGADRTGMMIAAYRMVVQNWTVDQAIDEMRRGGFGFNVLCGNLADYLRTLDIASIRRQAGLTRQSDGTWQWQRTNPLAAPNPLTQLPHAVCVP